MSVHWEEFVDDEVLKHDLGREIPASILVGKDEHKPGRPGRADSAMHPITLHNTGRTG